MSEAQREASRLRNFVNSARKTIDLLEAAWYQGAAVIVDPDLDHSADTANSVKSAVQGQIFMLKAKCRDATSRHNEIMMTLSDEEAEELRKIQVIN